MTQIMPESVGLPLSEVQNLPMCPEIPQNTPQKMPIEGEEPLAMEESVVLGSGDMIEKEEVEREGSLILFQPSIISLEGEEFSGKESFPISILPPLPPNWVMKKVNELQNCLGISCKAYADQFKALLTAIEANIIAREQDRNRELVYQL